MNARLNVDEKNVLHRFQVMLNELKTVHLMQQVEALQDEALISFQEYLLDSARAKDYLNDRGLSAQGAQRFALGYAPPGWNNLLAALEKYDLSVIQASGLRVFSKSNGKDRRYDFFRDRIMFPIRDVDGHVRGFGGRTLGTDRPKYLNSSESPVFQKRKAVYGLYEAQESIQAEGVAVMVEGTLMLFLWLRRDLETS